MNNNFYKRFGMELPYEEGKQKFVNRINNLVFKNIEKHSYYKEIFEFLCLCLGEDHNKFAVSRNCYDGSPEDYKKINRLTSNNFIKTLQILEFLSKNYNNICNINESIISTINLSKKIDGIQLGINFSNGIFYKTNNEKLDKDIIESSIHNTKGFEAEKFWNDAIKKFLKGDRVNTIENCYKSIEKLSQEILNNSKNLSSNKINILKFLGGSEGFSKQRSGILNSLYDYLCDHRHGTKGITNDDVSSLETQATLYQTGLILNLMINIQKEIT